MDVLGDSDVSVQTVYDVMANLIAGTRCKNVGLRSIDFARL